jgi:hypothetical protein
VDKLILVDLVAVVNKIVALVVQEHLVKVIMVVVVQVHLDMEQVVAVVEMLLAQTEHPVMVVQVVMVKPIHGLALLVI